MELLVIAGPTASGKTRRAVELAERISGEVVSADSQQVYRGFDVGTAKPSAEELSRVPHHLVSVAEPVEQFTAARFAALADEAIAEIARRGRRAIVAGGTGLYLRVLLHGVVEAPAADPQVRARLMKEGRDQGPEALHARLREVDPQSAAVLPVGDLVRVVRALEIYEQTGAPAFAARARHGFCVQRYAYRLFVLNPPREELYAAINERTRRMFGSGLLEEVRALVARGLRDCPAMKSVGYAQALAVLDGRLTVEEAITDAAQKTRNYAKRQLTWFKKEQGAQLISPPYAELADLS